MSEDNSWKPAAIPSERALADVLKRMCDIPSHTELQRAALQAYSSLIIEIARTVHVLQRMHEPELAAKLVGYASEVTDMACEHVRKSGEIES